MTIHLKIQEDDVELPENLLNLPVLMADDDEITCRSACLILDDIGMQGGMVSERGRSGAQSEKPPRDRRRLFRRDFRLENAGYGRRCHRQSYPDTVGPGIPIIFSPLMTGRRSAEARAAGVDHFLSKPLFKSRLVNSFPQLTIPRKPLKRGRSGLYERTPFRRKAHLLAEDNELNAEIAQELLQMTGYR